MKNVVSAFTREAENNMHGPTRAQDCDDALTRVEGSRTIMDSFPCSSPVKGKHQVSTSFRWTIWSLNTVESIFCPSGKIHPCPVYEFRRNLRAPEQNGHKAY